MNTRQWIGTVVLVAVFVGLTVVGVVGYLEVPTPQLRAATEKAEPVAAKAEPKAEPVTEAATEKAEPMVTTSFVETITKAVDELSTAKNAADAAAMRAAAAEQSLERLQQQIETIRSNQNDRIDSVIVKLEAIETRAQKLHDKLDSGLSIRIIPE